MANNILEQIKKNLTKYRKHKRWTKVVSVMMALVVFVTTYVLILPAITMETKTASCGLEEHAHTEECYKTVAPETKTELTCSLEEVEDHGHDETCYEIEEILVCELTEEDTDHVHTEECYEEKEILTCDKEEAEGHTHTEECYTTLEIDAEEDQKLVCGLEEHSHTEECYPDENPDEYKLTVTTPEGVTVVLEGPNTSFAQELEELSLTAEELDPDKEDERIVAAFETIDSAIEEEELLAESRRLFDIRLWHGDEEVEPIGPVKVTFLDIENPEESAAKVYHIDEEEAKATDMEASFDEYGNIFLDTDHFSIYAIALIEPLATNTMTLDDVIDGFGITNQFAVFTRRMGARGHIEGSIAVKEMELLEGPTFDFGNTRSVGSNAGSSNNVNLKITKITKGNAPAGREYKFGIYNSKNENVKLGEVSITGSGSKTINLNPGNYRVYELDLGGNNIEHGSKSPGFTVTYDAINLSGYLGGGDGKFVNNSSYIESFIKTNVTGMIVDQPGMLYVGEENTIELDTTNDNNPRIISGDYTVTATNLKSRIDKPTNINWTKEFNRIEKLSRDLAAQTTTDYNRNDKTTSGVRFLNIMVPSDGIISKETIASAIGDPDTYLNNGIPLGPSQYLGINLDTSQMNGNLVYISSIAPNKTDAGGWHPDYGRFMWNLHSGGSNYTGGIRVEESAGTILAPKATLNIDGVFNGAVLADHVIKDNDGGHEIHQHSFRPPSMAQTTVTNTYNGTTPPENPDLIINKEGSDGVKLDGVEFELYKSNENWDKGELVASQTTSEGQVKFEGLASGNYLLHETVTVDGYVLPAVPWKITVDGNNITFVDGPSDVSPNEGTNVTITNEKKTDETTSVTVNKVWEDSNNNTRPTSVTVYLLKNGEAFGDGIMLSNSNGWTHTWTDLPTQEGENAIIYGVKEGPIEGYISSIIENIVEDSDSKSFSFTITNTYEEVGYILPKVGGPGTKPYILAGILLMATSLIYILNRFRKGGHRTANSETKNI